MPALVERPKMSLAMWAALKTHIMRQREKKKQEQEADAATERVRREQEQKRKQDAMTLEEIKDQVQQSEKKLKDLKDEKHQLFLQLKKVLHEDDTRRRALVKEANEMAALNHSAYLQQALPQPVYLHDRAQSMYKPTVLHRAPMKRPLSPSPPPHHPSFPQQYAYKPQSYGPKLIPAYAPTSHGPIYYTHVPGQASVPTMATGTPVPYPGYQFPEVSKPQHHIVHGFHVPQQGYSGVPQPLEHSIQKPRFHDEKFYVSQALSIRPNVHTSQAAMVLAHHQQQSKTAYMVQQQLVQRHPGYPSQGPRFY
ncbi:G protein pathway suppressor 2-like [Ornithodoros turicata]|uniref:G protein pathway suppressor 2-like n=1 Tax=Ornithodoros turicata TaxID=34597 RepID=UPI003138D0EA